jgi:zinc/manganese transport system substrate-binding protein
MKNRLFPCAMSFFLFLLIALPAEARLKVVATTSSVGMVVRTVGGDAVEVTMLAPPDRDAHYLQARPSMMVALRRADLLMAVGAELEVGWLPAALQGAANPRLLPGRPGYFEAAAQVPVIDKDIPADRALGDVHPLGNPHVNMDPRRMAIVGLRLAERLAALNPDRAADFAAKAETFAALVDGRLPVWRARVANVPGVVLFHKEANYLMALLDVPILGYIEPLPGIPPTARHLQGLVEELEGRRGIIMRIEYQPPQGPDFVGRALGWPVVALPLDPPLNAGAEEYLALIDRWVEAIAGEAQ